MIDEKKEKDIYIINRARYVGDHLHIGMPEDRKCMLELYRFRIQIKYRMIELELV